MTQLAEDCFAFGAKSMTVAEALDVLRACVTAVAEIESVPLARGRGRILAEDVVSARAVPPHDNSAVDGYAFHFDDLVPDTETRLSLAGRAAAGIRSVAPQGAARPSGYSPAPPCPKARRAAPIRSSCRKTRARSPAPSSSRMA